MQWLYDLTPSPWWRNVQASLHVWSPWWQNAPWWQNVPQQGSSVDIQFFCHSVSEFLVVPETVHKLSGVRSGDTQCWKTTVSPILPVTWVWWTRKRVKPFLNWASHHHFYARCDWLTGGTVGKCAEICYVFKATKRFQSGSGWKQKRWSHFNNASFWVQFVTSSF